MSTIEFFRTVLRLNKTDLFVLLLLTNIYLGYFHGREGVEKVYGVYVLEDAIVK